VGHSRTVFPVVQILIGQRLLNRHLPVMGFPVGEVLFNPICSGPFPLDVRAALQAFTLVVALYGSSCSWLPAWR